MSTVNGHEITHCFADEWLYRPPTTMHRLMASRNDTDPLRGVEDPTPEDILFYGWPTELPPINTYDVTATPNAVKRRSKRKAQRAARRLNR